MTFFRPQPQPFSAVGTISIVRLWIAQQFPLVLESTSLPVFTGVPLRVPNLVQTEVARYGTLIGKLPVQDTSLPINLLKPDIVTCAAHTEADANENKSNNDNDEDDCPCWHGTTSSITITITTIGASAVATVTAAATVSSSRGSTTTPGFSFKSKNHQTQEEKYLPHFEASNSHRATP